MTFLLFLLTDWFLGPKPVEDDSEEGRPEIEEERRVSVSSRLMGSDRLRMEKEKDGLLPGFHQGDGGGHRPSTPPPLKSAITSYSGEKRISTHSVTFACPATPYVTSLWLSATSEVHCVDVNHVMLVVEMYFFSNFSAVINVVFSL